MAPLLDAAGWVGALALLSGYALVSSGRLRSGGVGFQRVNLVGATGLAVNSVYHGAWPSVALNAVWLAIGVVTLLRLRRVTRGGRPSDRLSSPGGRRMVTESDPA